MTIASYPQTTKEIYKKNFIPFPFPNLDQELCKIKMKWNNLIVIIINKGLCEIPKGEAILESHIA